MLQIPTAHHHKKSSRETKQMKMESLFSKKNQIASEHLGYYNPKKLKIRFTMSIMLINFWFFYFLLAKFAIISELDKVKAKKKELSRWAWYQIKNFALNHFSIETEYLNIQSSCLKEIASWGSWCNIHCQFHKSSQFDRVLQIRPLNTFRLNLKHNWVSTFHQQNDLLSNAREYYLIYRIFAD